MKRVAAESSFSRLVSLFNLPDPVPEHRFHPTRRFRFDFAWPEKRVAVEIEGGVYSHGRHVRGKGYERDIEKYNLATLGGWRVLRFTPGQLKSNPGKCVDQVRRMLEAE